MSRTYLGAHGRVRVDYTHDLRLARAAADHQFNKAHVEHLTERVRLSIELHEREGFDAGRPRAVLARLKNMRQELEQSEI